MDRSDLLRAIPLFESLSDDDVTALSSRLEEETQAPGVVFKEGSDGATMYVIQEGAVEISLGDGKTKVAVAHLYAGQYFGELSLLDGQPRSATAIATKPCTFLALNRDDFVEFIKSRPGAALHILADIAERLRQTNVMVSSIVSKNVVEEEEEHLTVGQRVADRVASFGGSWPFIFLFGGFMVVWMMVNLVAAIAWDHPPYILLNLILSTLAALQAPVIMMSQNRQASKDKLLSENDFQVNLKAELGIQNLIKGQAELLARLALLERRVGGQGPGTRVQS